MLTSNFILAKFSGYAVGTKYPVIHDLLVSVGCPNTDCTMMPWNMTQVKHKMLNVIVECWPTLPNKEKQHHNTSCNSMRHTLGFTSNGGLLEGSAVTPSGEASPKSNNDSQTLTY